MRDGNTDMGAAGLAAVALLSVAAGLFGPSQRAQATDVFTRLEGSWEGDGTLFGGAARFHMTWHTDERGFVHLAFGNARVEEDGTVAPLIEASAVYQVDGTAARGVWIDDRPQRIELDAVLTDSTVTTRWTAPEERGTTEYVVRSADEVVVLDFVEVDGAPRMFGEARYRRRPGPE